MNKAAITKHEIYNKLIDFSEQDLNEIDKYIDFLRFKNKSIIFVPNALSPYTFRSFPFVS